MTSTVTAGRHHRHFVPLCNTILMLLIPCKSQIIPNLCLSFLPLFRLNCEPNNSLAPSYRTLFENVDRTVDCDGYENTQPLHLKTITLAGLPVEDIPCLEVWDLSGKVRMTFLFCCNCCKDMCVTSALFFGQ